MPFSSSASGSGDGDIETGQDGVTTPTRSPLRSRGATSGFCIAATS